MTQTVDEKLNALLKRCCSNVARLKYEGNPKQYITFQMVTVSDKAFADDDNECVEHYYRIDLYSKGNYMTMLNTIKAALKSAGWYEVVINNEIYEQDTGYCHVPVEAKYMEVI